MDIGVLPETTSLNQFLRDTGRATNARKFYRVLEVVKVSTIETVEPPTIVNLKETELPTIADARECVRLRKMAELIEEVQAIDEDEDDIDPKDKTKAEVDLTKLHQMTTRLPDVDPDDVGSVTELVEQIIVARGLELPGKYS